MITTWNKIYELYGDKDRDMLLKAYNYAKEAHSNQKRASGEPYFIHPCAVALILMELGLDAPTVAAALLHDVIEDTPATEEDIKRAFGDEVLELVSGVTKLDKIVFKSQEQEEAENFRKIFVAMAKDIRVIIIKMADRLHNMRSLNFLSPERQQKMARETLDIFAPLAGRLGISQIKCELEDLCLKYLDPEAYEYLVVNINEKLSERREFVNSIVKEIKDMMEADGIRGEVFGRPKHFYSIYKKMKNKGKSLDQIYDLTALRVIVGDVKECYTILGEIHEKWKPLPGRIKDYIANPKPNKYQSLHTTVMTRFGQPFEIQIRTEEMHRIAEFGIAAHWKYKEGRTEEENSDFENKLTWLREVMEWQGAVKDPREFLDALKTELYSDELLVFTPRGKVISLPAGSTPIDFAYAIHSAVGNSMIGAKVNNRIASYDAPLHNGDIVEILTSKSAKGPSRDWLNICQSNQARIKIKQWFKREKRDENIVRGKTSFDAELRHIGVDPDLIQNDDVLPLVLKKVSFECLDDMYAAIGYGGLTAAKAVGRIRDDLTKASRSLAPKPLMRQETPAVNASGVIVEDIGSCMIKFSRCCTPVPGDEIIGFITKGYGVSVHRKDCPNAKSAQDPAQKGRWVKVTWAETPDALFSTSLEIEADDRDGLMLDVATILTSLRLRTSEMSARSVGGGTAIVCLRFGVHNLTELENVRTRLRGISGVHNVERGTE